MTAPEEGVWDTTVASRIQPGTDALGHVEARASAGEPVIVAAVALSEIARGYRKQAARDERYADLLDWLIGFALGDLVEVAELDALAAIAYGQARALRPTPPGARRKSRHRTRTEHRAAWLSDIQIAATAWARGLPVVTEDREDFEHISRLLVELYPDVDPLEVVDPPDFTLELDVGVEVQLIR